jgi:NodT family efflux transporter outer membrane factor (OMF) lipoprotein
MKTALNLLRVNSKRILFIGAIALLAAGCNLAPQYKVPPVETPAIYQEHSPTNNSPTNILWQVAQPGDSTNRGTWWEAFHDDELNALEGQLIISNQNIVVAYENYVSARETVREARSEYYPTLTTSPQVTRSRQSLSTQPGTSKHNPNITEYSLPLDGSWQPDFWGRVRNTVRADVAAAQASAADLENTRLAAQGELAADYFQLRAQDSLEKVFDDTVASYRQSLDLENVLFKTGIASDQDVAQAETQLETTEAQATNLRILRAQLQHAIAVLIGRPPSAVSVSSADLTAVPPATPVGIPSQLLERRPDVAAAERAVAEANAQIGVARSAFFPTITLTASGGFESTTVGNLFDWPSRVWSLGAGASETLFNAGAFAAALVQYRAEYTNAVAEYRETVLTAFQQVEDNLVSLQVLDKEIQQQDAAVKASARYLDLAKTRYKLGIDSYLNVITAQTTLLSNRQTLLNLRSQQMTAAVQLIEALGGGWDNSQLPGNL